MIRDGQVVYRAATHALALAWVGDRQATRQGAPGVRLAAAARRIRTVKES